MSTNKGRETRERMIVAAATLFRRQGFDGTGLSEILERGGAPRGSLYFHFPGGKEELAAAAVTASGVAIGRHVERVLAASDDLAEAIGSVVDLMAADVERSGYRGGCPIAAVTLDSAMTADAIRAACLGAFEHWLDLLAARLRRAGWSDAAARDEALLILAAIEGALTIARARRDPEALHAVARRLRARLA